MSELVVSSRNIVILLGGPGAGKGTQAGFISTFLKIPHISTGQLLREEAQIGSLLGLKVKGIMDAGELVSADLVNELVECRIQKTDCIRGFILDGYPRDLGQAVTFGRLLNRRDRQIVIDIHTDLDKVLPRMTGRRTCRLCNTVYHVITLPPRRAGLCDLCGAALMQRSDDREDVIRQRFRTYEAQTVPLKHYYREQGFYHQVDGLCPRADVSRKIQRLLERKLAVAVIGSPVLQIRCDASALRGPHR